MVQIVAELSYYASGSNFNLQFGPYKNILLCVQEFLGDHYGNPRHNVVVRETAIAGRYALLVVANCRFNIVQINATKRSEKRYVELAQQHVWHITGH